MKAIHFLVNSNIWISVAAVCLALTTGSELGLPVQFHAYLPVIFLATLFDYNLHRFIEVHTEPEAVRSGKLSWPVKHSTLLKFLILSSATGLVVSLFFVRKEILIILVPLAVLSFCYSIRFPVQKKNTFRLFRIPGIKTFLIAVVWSSATVFIPFVQLGSSSDYTPVMLIFAERFAFIFGIAIPFDIRDMKPDEKAGIRTIPVAFGENRALLICNSAMIISLSIASFHYFSQRPFVFISYFVSIALTLIFINSRKLKSYPLYYHGILDGSIILHGLLISIGFLVSDFLTL